MAIQGVTYNNQKVSAADHAALFQMFITDGTMSGCGISTLRNTLTISSGLFIIAGRLTKIIGSETITIPNGVVSTTKKLIGVCDMAGVSSTDSFGQFYFKLEDNNYVARKENINTGTGLYYEIEWATLTIDASSNITACSVTIPEAGSSGGGGGSVFITEDDYTFSGDANKILYSSSGTDWEIIILEAAAATLNFSKRPGLVDICLVSAGSDGNRGNNASAPGTGGNGGQVLNQKSFTLEQGGYAVTIGSAISGADHDTSISNSGSAEVLLKAYQANGENNGGNDSTAFIGKNLGDGGDGVFAFDDDEIINSTYKSRKYGAGGGRGGLGTRGGTVDHANGSGGTTGGGNGGWNPSDDDQNVGSGAANTGSGGGGGRRLKVGNTWYNNSAGGLGGSGIIIIRNHRATPAV